MAFPEGTNECNWCPSNSTILPFPDICGGGKIQEIFAPQSSQKQEMFAPQRFKNLGNFRFAKLLRIRKYLLHESSKIRK